MPGASGVSGEAVVGWYEMPIEFVGIVPWEKRLSVTVGTGSLVERVPRVRSTGPMLKTRHTSITYLV